MTGRSHPTTLGESDIEEIRTRTGLSTRIKRARRVTTPITDELGTSPRRLNRNACLQPSIRRAEKMTTPSDHSGNAQRCSQFSQPAAAAIETLPAAGEV